MLRRRLLRYLCCESLAEEGMGSDCTTSSLSVAFRPPSSSFTCAETLAHIRSLPAEEEPEVRVAFEMNVVLACKLPSCGKF